MEYVWTQISPDRIEDGRFEVNGNQLRVEHTGGGVSKCKLAPDEDAKRAARRLLREHFEERGGAFWNPINYPQRPRV